MAVPAGLPVTLLRGQLSSPQLPSGPFAASAIKESSISLPRSFRLANKDPNNLFSAPSIPNAQRPHHKQATNLTTAGALLFTSMAADPGRQKGGLEQAAAPGGQNAGGGPGGLYGQNVATKFMKHLHRLNMAILQRGGDGGGGEGKIFTVLVST